MLILLYPQAILRSQTKANGADTALEESIVWKRNNGYEWFWDFGSSTYRREPREYNDSCAIEREEGFEALSAIN